MNARTLRRAAERAALKAARKEQRAAANALPEPISTPVATTASSAPTTPEPRTPSPAQLAANRANAQLSTGPSSTAGKAISSRNHTKHGLTAIPGPGPFQVLPDENQADYDLYYDTFIAEWKPVTATELDLVERLCIHAWLRRRAQRLQDERLARGMKEMQDFKQFEVYARYYALHLRAFNKAFADLMRLRSFQMRQVREEAAQQRRAQEAQFRFESQQRKAAEHAAKMETIRLKQEAQKQRNLRLKPAPDLSSAAGTGTLHHPEHR